MELWALCAQTTGTALVLVQTGIPELSLGLWLQGKSGRGESGVCPEVWFVPFLVWPHGLRAPAWPEWLPPSPVVTVQSGTAQRGHSSWIAVPGAGDEL